MGDATTALREGYLGPSGVGCFIKPVHGGAVESLAQDEFNTLLLHRLADFMRN